MVCSLFQPRSVMSPAVEVRGSIDELYLLLCASYAQARAAAKRLMRQERVAHTLQPTALVHEAFLRLIGQNLDAILDSKNFVGLAVREMERILVDYSRRVHAEKRGNGLARVPLEKVDR